MKKSINRISVFLFSFFFFQQGFAQTQADGLKAMDNENYATAKSIFGGLLKANPADAMKWYNYGEALFADEKIDSAKMMYQGGIAADAKEAHNYIGMGKCLLADGKKDEAKKMFDKALDLAPSKDVEVKTLVGLGYISSEKNAMFEPAIEIVNKAIAINKKYVLAYQTLGDIYLLKSDGGAAMTNYETATQIDKNNKIILLKQGELWVNARQLTSAEPLFKQAIAIDPAFAPAHRELADLYFQTKQFDKANIEFDEYLKYADPSFDSKVRKVKILFKAKLYDDCVNETNKLLVQAPNSYLLYRLLGYSSLELNKPAEAEAAMNKFFEKAPAEKILASDYSTYVKALTKGGKDSLAVLAMKKVMEVDKGNTEYVSNILSIYFNQKKYDEVIKEYEAQTSKGYKADIKTAYYAARSYYTNKDFVKADSMNAIITRISPSQTSGWIGRAQCNAQLDPESTQGLAKPYYEKYLEVVKLDDPKQKNYITQAYAYLGYYYYLQKDNAATQSWFEKVLAIDPENQQAKDVLAALKK